MKPFRPRVKKTLEDKLIEATIPKITENLYAPGTKGYVSPANFYTLIARQTGHQEKTVLLILDAMTEIIVEAMRRRVNIRIPCLGTFRPIEWTSGPSSMVQAEGKRVSIRFKQTPKLRTDLNPDVRFTPRAQVREK